MSNPYYNPDLEDLCRETMRNFLKLYFEFAFKLDEEVSCDFVAKTNEIYDEVLDESITTERLLTIYNGAVSGMESKGNLRSFCMLPALFVMEDIDGL